MLSNINMIFALMAMISMISDPVNAMLSANVSNGTNTEGQDGKLPSTTSFFYNQLNKLYN